MKEQYSEPPSQEMKHLSIIHAINRLKEVKDQAEKLLCKINGDDREEESESVESTPTLAATISRSGNAIADLAEQISTHLMGIEGQLF